MSLVSPSRNDRNLVHVLNQGAASDALTIDNEDRFDPHTPTSPASGREGLPRDPVREGHSNLRRVQDTFDQRRSHLDPRLAHQSGINQAGEHIETDKMVGYLFKNWAEKPGRW